MTAQTHDSAASSAAASPAASLAGRFATQRWILRVVGARLWKVAGLSLLQAALAGLGIAYALVMRRIIDAAVAGSASGFANGAAALIAITAVQLAGRALSRYLVEDVRSQVENALRDHTFQGILDADLARTQARHSGDLMSRLTSDVVVIADAIAQFIPGVVSMAVRIVGALAVLFVLLPVIAWAFVAAGAVMGLASIALRGHLKRLHANVQEAESRVRTFLQECLESLLVVRAFGRQDKMASINNENMQAHRRARMRRSNASNACNVGAGLAVQGSYLLGFLWCCHGILAGTVSYGTLMAAVQLIGQIQSPFASMGSTFSRYSAMLASAERLMEVAEPGADLAAASSEDGKKRSSGAVRAAAPAGEKRAEAAAAAAPAGEKCVDAEAPAAPAAAFSGAADLYALLDALSFDHVTFGYGRDAVLRDLSLQIRRGEFVALAGPSGAGKSTLVKLLMGARVPSAGRVALLTSRGAVDPVHAPAGLFAYVPQGNLLMSGTIREVVCFADEAGAPADEARLREACRAACADEFVRELPLGLDTPLGERGAGLSEGQMQRLAVARAVYSQAPILLLDEVTSALDADTEKRMLARLRELPGRTAVVVTHRAEAMQRCDRVVRLAGEGGA